MTKVSIGIVTYNNEDKICELLDSVYKYTTGIEYQMYVVDNASSDNTVRLIEENYPGVVVLKMQNNLGFGAGHNKVIEYIRSDYHMIASEEVCAGVDFKERRVFCNEKKNRESIVCL